MSAARLIEIAIGEGTLLDISAIIGHLSKVTQLKGGLLTIVLGQSLGPTVSSAQIGSFMRKLPLAIMYKLPITLSFVKRSGLEMAVYLVVAQSFAGAKLGCNVRAMEQSLICEDAVIGNDVFVAPQVSFNAVVIC